MNPLEELQALAATIQSNPALSTALGKPWIFQNAKENISHIFGKCDANQRKLFLSLLSRYQILDQYEPYAFQIVEKIAKQIESGIEIILTTPSVKVNSRPKSGDLLLYEIKSQLNGRGISDRQFVTKNIISATDVNGGFYIIVDDFSGTGDTIITALDKLMIAGVKPQNIRVELIYAMDVAVKSIILKGVMVNRQVSAGKCISDFDYSSSGIDFDAGLAYDKLESELQVVKKYKRGYKQSEALVSMKRTPNNTLPIFWHPEGRAGDWPAPFPR